MTHRRAETTPEPSPKPTPTWRNTRPRGNPAPDRRDVARSEEKLAMVLGR